MGFFSFDRNGDLAFAKQDARIIFEKQETVSKENIQIFEKSFITSYELYKSIFQKKEKFAKGKNFQENFSEAVRTAMSQVAYAMKEYRETRKPDKLGRSLGIFMAVLRYGVTSGHFFMQEYIGEYTDVANNVLQEAQEMMTELQKIDRTLHLSGIALRCEIIRKDKRKVLPYNQYNDFITELKMLIITHRR